jgi:hypothetical protein
MVNKKADGGVHNMPVHTNKSCPAGTDFEVPEGIEFSSVSTEIPVEVFKLIIVLWFNNCPFTFAQGNFAERIAELAASICHYRPRENSV